MATSGYGNRLAGGNQFFQGPRGPGWRLASGGPRVAPVEVLSVLGRHRDPPQPGITDFPASLLQPLPRAGPLTRPPRPSLKRPPHRAVNRWTNYHAAAGELAGTSLLKKLCLGRG